LIRSAQQSKVLWHLQRCYSYQDDDWNESIKRDWFLRRPLGNIFLNKN
jgi:hypothetical protein